MGRPLVLKPKEIAMQPYKRCLNLHAHLARNLALKNKWITEKECMFEDFSSEGMKTEEKMEMFLQSLHIKEEEEKK